MLPSELTTWDSSTHWIVAAPQPPGGTFVLRILVPLLEIAVPPLSELGSEPRLGEDVYQRRLGSIRQRMDRAGLDALLVYADREHYANVAYLTGFDPRFEEALLVLRRTGEPVVVTGNESISLCECAGVPTRAVLCQSFSLPSQDRSIRRRLADALGEAGLARSDRSGLIGWKPIPPEDAPTGRYALAIPQFVLSEIETFLSSDAVDATELLAGLEGERAINEADQLALHEHRSTKASHCVWRALEALRVGATELEISRSMRLEALPLSCHVMCASGTEKVIGLRSATDRPIGNGDYFSTAVGYWGGLCCRAGLVADPDDAAAYIERFAAPYFAAVATWYRSLRIGARTGDVSEAVERALSVGGLKPMLNAGHLIHLDEWLDTPFAPASDVKLKSGMALQCDIIPESATNPGDAANAEDSLAIADADLRAELMTRFPDLWERVVRRREFMIDTLEIELADEVLLFSDRQGMLAPALLTLECVLTS
jgi:hypothetical protein